MGKKSTYWQRGEVVTLLTIAAMVVVGLSVFVTSLVTNKTQKTTNTQAAGIPCSLYPNIGPPDTPPNHYYWQADCNSTEFLRADIRAQRSYCVSSSECIQNTGKPDSGYMNPSTSNFCYSHFGSESATDNRCMMLRYEPVVPKVTTTPTPPAATPTSVQGICSTVGQACQEDYEYQGLACHKRNGTCTCVGGGTCCSWGAGSCCAPIGTNCLLGPTATPRPGITITPSLSVTVPPQATVPPPPPGGGQICSSNNCGACNSCNTCIGAAGCGWQTNLDGSGGACVSGAYNSCPAGKYWHWNSCYTLENAPNASIKQKVSLDMVACSYICGSGKNCPAGWYCNGETASTGGSFSTRYCTTSSTGQPSGEDSVTVCNGDPNACAVNATKKNCVSTNYPPYNKVCSSSSQPSSTQCQGDNGQTFNTGESYCQDKQYMYCGANGATMQQNCTAEGKVCDKNALGNIGCIVPEQNPPVTTTGETITITGRVISFDGFPPADSKQCGNIANKPIHGVQGMKLYVKELGDQTKYVKTKVSDGNDAGTFSITMPKKDSGFYNICNAGVPPAQFTPPLKYYCSTNNKYSTESMTSFNSSCIQVAANQSDTDYKALMILQPEDPSCVQTQCPAPNALVKPYMKINEAGDPIGYFPDRNSCINNDSSKLIPRDKFSSYKDPDGAWLAGWCDQVNRPIKFKINVDFSKRSQIPVDQRPTFDYDPVAKYFYEQVQEKKKGSKFLEDWRRVKLVDERIDFTKVQNGINGTPFSDSYVRDINNADVFDSFNQEITPKAIEYQAWFCYKNRVAPDNPDQDDYYCFIDVHNKFPQGNPDANPPNNLEEFNIDFKQKQ